MEDLSSDESFEAFCIVCDRVIAVEKPPPSPAIEAKVEKPKKKPAGNIRIKNPDGTTTTRSANGTKTTRPALKRNPTSQSRLATMAANNNAASRLAPLTRSKTAESTKSSASGDSATANSTPSSPVAAPIKAFKSNIYCSIACAQIETARTDAYHKNIVRTLSMESGIFPANDALHVQIPVPAGTNPYAPPSPLFHSSDTDSSGTSTGQAADALPASSAPNAMNYFRMLRGGPDDAWRDIERQRRGSMQPSYRPLELSRQHSITSPHMFINGAVSSDSLSSMGEADMSLGRSTSGSGRMRMTPLQRGDEQSLASARRSVSIANGTPGERSIAIPRPLVRSNLSQTSLADELPAAVMGTSYGSPRAYSMLSTYIPPTNPDRVPASYSNVSLLGLSERAPSGEQSRRSSMNYQALSRPIMGANGTIKGKPPTWDSFGKDALAEQARWRRASSNLGQSGSVALGGGLSLRSSSGVGVPVPDAQSPRGREYDCTPKQSLTMENGHWVVKYKMSSSRGSLSARSGSQSSGKTSHSNEVSPTEALPITGASNKGDGLPVPFSASANTPRHYGKTMPPPTFIPVRPHAQHVNSTPNPVPGLSNLVIGSHSSSASLSAMFDASNAGNQNVAASAPRAGFNWDGYEQCGGKLYEIPKGVQKSASRTGLFYFK